MARAEAPSKVILVEPGVPALAHRLREEIESLGFEVLLVPEVEPPSPLELRARSAGAVAAIRVSQSGQGAVEMTIVDRATGKTVSRRLAITTSTDPAAAELIATRTVELLRASLMELAAVHPARGDAPVTPEVRALTPRLERERAATVALALGPALTYSPGFGVSPDAWAGVAVLTSIGLGATAQVFVPLAAAELESREGSVELFASIYRLGGLFELGAGSTLGVRFSAGVALARLSLSGAADTPYFGSDDELLAFGPWLGAALRIKLPGNFGMLLGGDASLILPRTVIRSAGREVATWGRPLASATAALELSFP